MSKLKKYSTFEDLKSDIKPTKTAGKKENKLLLEFETFLKQAQREFSINQQAKEAHGKQPGSGYPYCLQGSE